jgi:hypothetical protein
MTERRFKPLAMLLPVIALLMALCGCLGRSQPPRFYLMTPISSIPAEGTAAGIKEGLRIGVGPIFIPEYVDRAQIVTRLSSHELALAEFNQWSEPLKESIPRILGENLSSLLSTDYIYMYPWLGSIPIDYQIWMDITRLDAELEGTAVLTARWRLLPGDSKEILLVKYSTITQPTGGADYADLVAAESKALAQLSREIAAAITSLAKSK